MGRTVDLERNFAIAEEGAAGRLVGRAKIGDVRRLCRLMPYLNGVEVDVVRQSKSTGGYTVRLREAAPDSPAYPAGTELHVSGFNLEA